MPSDPFRKVQPGDPFEVAAPVWNALLDVAQARQLGDEAGTPTTLRNAAIVKVKNESGADLVRRSVLGLDAPIFTPTDSEDAFLREVTFRGVTPTTAHHLGKFCVLLEPALQHQVVRAYVAGVCQVRVNVGSLLHRHADVKDGDCGVLTSAYEGGATILWCEGDAGYGYATGDQWALVSIGHGGPTAAFAKVTTQIEKATGVTRPGKGFIQRYTAIDLTTTPATLSGLTGVDERAVQVFQDKKVLVNKTVFVVKALGVWQVTNPDSCASLAT